MSLINLDDSIELPRHVGSTEDEDHEDLCRWKELDEISDVMKLLHDEKFDFDLPLSPKSESSMVKNDAAPILDDEEEIFFGPVRYKEICVATAVNENEKVADQCKPLSPLSAAEMAQLCKEAFTVSCRIRIATGSNDVSDPVLSSAAGSTPAAFPAPTTGPAPLPVFHPLDQPVFSFSKKLPVEKQIFCDENGMVKFQGAKYNEQTFSEDSDKKSVMQLPSKLPLKAHQSKVAKVSFLQRSRTSGCSGNIVQKPASSPSESVLSCLTNRMVHVQSLSERSPMMKRFRSEGGKAVAAGENISTVCNDTCDSSLPNQLSGKRGLLAPKIKGSTLSRLPQLSAVKRLELARPKINSSAIESACNLKPALPTLTHFQHKHLPDFTRHDTQQRGLESSSSEAFDEKI